MNEFIGKFELEEVALLDCHSNIKFSIENIDDPIMCSQLVAATKQIKDISSYRLLTLLLTEKVARKLDLTSIPKSKPENVKALAAELYHTVQVSIAKQTGFIYDEKKKKYTFNANLFAHYFMKRIKIVSNQHGFLYAYNKKGFFKMLSDIEMGQLVRILMNEGLANSWKSRYEKEAVEAIKRECLSATEMDTAANYINMKNGMYSLDEGILEPHSPDFLSTVQIPIEYDSNAICPKFIKFINEVSCGDKELVSVHQEMIGYLLSSETKCEKAFYYIGWGANGKSVLTKVISILVGEQNVGSISLSQFSSDFGLEGIIGKKVNIASENEMRGFSLNTEVFKAMVSGDGMTINIKHRSALTNYKVKCKFLFATNQLPNTEDYTNGYYRRITMLPFKRTFSDKEQNLNLINELLKELPGIYNWAIKGLERLRAQNYIFSQAQVIEEELNHYRISQHPVLSYFESMIELDVNSKVKRADVHEFYKFWCEEQGLSSLTQRTPQKFYDELRKIIDSKYLPIHSSRIDGYDYFKGIKLKVS